MSNKLIFKVGLFSAIVAGLFMGALSSRAGLTEGGIMSFDINPKTITATNRAVTVTLKVTIYEPQFKNYCGIGYNNEFIWKVSEENGGSQVRFGTQAIDNTQSSKEYNLDFATTLVPRTTSGTRTFIARIACNNGILWDTIIATSSPVTLTQGGGLGTSYACISAGKYECSPTGKSDCSDNTKCTGNPKPACIVIPVANCGMAAATPTPPGGGTCGGANQPTCAPGASQSYQFTVPNWLIGQPTDLVALLDIIAKWLFNLSIPVAVGFIIYAGVLLMTAGANPANVKKGGNVLKYVAIGLAIIFINKGFISLIRSILELGNS